MDKSPEFLAHREWLGYVQPVGLVVSIPALLSAQATIDRNFIPSHQRFLECLPRTSQDELIPELRDFGEFTQQVLGWRPSDLEPVVPGDPRYTALEVHLPEYHETLRPTHVVREMEPKDPEHPWMMLVQLLPPGIPIDKPAATSDRNWNAPPQARFERLLREARVPIGILSNATCVRLVYAPRGETSGYASFDVGQMSQVSGRIILAALYMLLKEQTLFSLAEKRRLPAILSDSRKYQNVVSTKLAEQVLTALYELVRGFQAADEPEGNLLREVLAQNPNHVYQGLLTVLMRLVFVLYAEDRGLLSNDPVFTGHYSLTGLFNRLRADAGRHTDTMHQRFGAWAQLLNLFRLIYDGGSHGDLRIPARQGYLFDPDRYNFLEGRPWKTSHREHSGPVRLPHVSDGVIYRVLEKLLILDGERLSYRTLDVEQIGSVYETMMGLELEVAQGQTIGLRLPKKNKGIRPPVSVNLESLLAKSGADRLKYLKAMAEWEPSTKPAAAIRKAATIPELLSALETRIHREATPDTVPKGAMALQPSEERRRSGSHYTPRSLTEPIVRATLKPVLEQFGAQPSPEQILSLKVCDPAMGSGAFLVEACRQLADVLVTAWAAHGIRPLIPPDEDEILHARRLVAQRCLYGVDRNPMAVDLSKLALWLATLAKDHPFTFVDHALRYGDSLVGLTTEQISAFHWDPPASRKGGQGGGTFMATIQSRITRATENRRMILDAGDNMFPAMKHVKLQLAEEALAVPRLIGDACVSAFFAGDSNRIRQARRDELFGQLADWVSSDFDIRKRNQIAAAAAALRLGPHPTQPFHWQIEFPEVYTVDAKGNPTGGFDAIVGNPPFAGKNNLISGNREGYVDWLKTLHEESHGNADLVAHFFRRAFNLLRPNGCFGLIATNTIGQGDTRSTGLRWICTRGGTIYAARKRLRWPGQAAVVVSVVNICRGTVPQPFVLDGRNVPIITAYLFHAGGHENAATLEANANRSFIGSYVLGMGFTFDDEDTSGVTNPLSLMHELIAKDRRNAERIFPYIGGEEVSDSPSHAHHRYIIDFDDWPLQRSDTLKLWRDADQNERAGMLSRGVVPKDYPNKVAADWPQLLSILETKVRADRKTKADREARERWWNFLRPRPEMRRAISGMDRVLVVGRNADRMGFAIIPTKMVYSEQLVVFATSDLHIYAMCQSRCHESWARFSASSMKDDMRYTPSDCFETFPFPIGVFEHAAGGSPTTDNGPLTALETAGREYYEFRGALMVRHNEGLTRTYNRFHDPDERNADILKLRELHAAMDRAVLEAYGWPDLAQIATCEFLLDYEDEEEEEEPTSGRARTRRKPWRYRWPDDFRDEVLARLLALNAQRAEEERLSGVTAGGKSGKKRMGKARATSKRAKKSKTNNAGTPELPDI